MAEEDFTLSEFARNNPEMVLAPAGGVAGASASRRSSDSVGDNIRGATIGGLTGLGAAGGAVIGKRLAPKDELAGILVGGGTGGLLSYIAARKALHRLFPTREERRKKEAGTIDELKTVKSESDRRNYKAKHYRLNELMRTYPDDWYIDSRDGNMIGITHKTGFRFHMPQDKVPQPILNRPVGVAPWQQSTTP